MSNGLFVRNLPWNASDDDLMNHFKDNGCNPTTVEIQYTTDGTKSKGWALVKFETAEEASECISRCNDQDFTAGENTRPLHIREDRGPSEPRPARTSKPRRERREPAEPGLSLYVGNLPWSTSWQDLKDLFANYNVKYTTIKYGFDGRSRGYGIARFDTQDDAQNAIDAMNGYEYNGRPIVVRFDSPRGKGAVKQDNSSSQPLDAPQEYQGEEQFN